MKTTTARGENTPATNTTTTSPIAEELRALRERIEELKALIAAPQRDTMDIGEAAEFLRLSKGTIYKYTADRAIPHARFGNRIVFSRAELDRWVQSKRVETVEETKRRAQAAIRRIEEQREAREKRQKENVLRALGRIK